MAWWIHLEFMGVQGPMTVACLQSHLQLRWHLASPRSIPLRPRQNAPSPVELLWEAKHQYASIRQAATNHRIHHKVSWRCPSVLHMQDARAARWTGLNVPTAKTGTTQTHIIVCHRKHFQPKLHSSVVSVHKYVFLLTALLFHDIYIT